MKYTDPDGRSPKIETIYVPKDFEISNQISAKNLKNEWNALYDLKTKAELFYNPLAYLFKNTPVEKAVSPVGKIASLAENCDYSTAFSKLTTYLELIAPNQDEINFEEFNSFYRNIDTESNTQITKTISVKTTVKDKESGGINLHGIVITTKTSITYTNNDTGESITLKYKNVKMVTTCDLFVNYKVEIAEE